MATKTMEEVNTIQTVIFSKESSAIMADSDYVLILPQQFSLAYDDVLQDVSSMIGNHKLACFGTVYEADNVNKFDSHKRSPLLSPSVSAIINHPSAFMACVMSREIYSQLNFSGRSIYEAIAGSILEQPVNECVFIPLNILTTPLHSFDIDSQVSDETLRHRFCLTHPLLADDYRFLFGKQDLATADEATVLEKLGKTRFFRFVMWFRKQLEKIGYYKSKSAYKYKQYIKKVRREDAARIAAIAEKIDKLPFDMLKAKGDETDIVVSLTSFGKRVSESAPYGIYSLFTQTVLPNRIVLSIDKEKWNEDNLPPLIKRLQKSGLEVLFCKDVRSHTKLLPALAKYPDNPIITVDDDMIYEPHMIEELTQAYAQSDKRTVMCRQGVYPKKGNGKYVPYMEWDDSANIPDEVQNKRSCPVSPYGVYGVLYPPHIFDEEVFNDKVFMEIAPHTDDIWFWVMELRGNIKAEVVRPTRQRQDGSVSLIEYLEESESSALYFQNCFGGRNDAEMKRLVEYYHI